MPNDTNVAESGTNHNTSLREKDRKTRTRTGCLNCRRRRRKCDEVWPTCLNCSKRNEVCERGVRLSFRAENAHTLDDDDHALERPVKRPRQFEIRDMTEAVTEQYHQYSPTMHLNSPHEEDAQRTPLGSRLLLHQLPLNGISDTLRHATEPINHGTTTSDSHQPSSANVRDHATDHQGLMSPFATRTNDTSAQYHTRMSLERTTSNISSAGPSTMHTTPQNQTENAAENLLHLRNLRQSRNSGCSMTATFDGNDTVLSPTFSSPTNQITPDSLFDDGIFLPGSTYRELHTTLRQHLIDETNSAAQSRAYSPDFRSGEENWLASRVTLPIDVRKEINHEEPRNEQTPPLELSREEEYKLWKTWIDEVASWLDKFDNHRHFQHTLPTMAKTCDHLRFSILAVSARQIELKNASKPTDQSLALYQQAIHLLVPQLHTRTTIVLASCVVLCVLEMLSCSPKAWRRHLDGCANLIQAVGINGFSGGLEQALFWCFARMDVCGGLIDSMKTLIPVDHWASKIDIDADVGMFKASGGFDLYANYAVYLCARIVDLLSMTRDRRSRSDEKIFIYQWTKLWRYTQDWEARRLLEMLPVTTIASTTMSPFPIVLYSNAAAISGNQLFHTASILLLQNKPANVRLDPKPRPIHWHARQICGISLSNDHHGAWTNSIQPLWIAGRCMSQPNEQHAIIQHLHKIEAESGWGTKWRIEDLRQHWEIEYG